jgi:hypothetical protein
MVRATVAPRLRRDRSFGGCAVHLDQVGAFDGRQHLPSTTREPPSTGLSTGLPPSDCLHTAPSSSKASSRLFECVDQRLPARERPRPGAFGIVDIVQVIYDVSHQEPAERLLPACQEQGVDVIVRVALDEN